MRKIKPSTDNSENVLAKIGARLQGPYKALYSIREMELKSVYRKYDTKMRLNALESLSSSIFMPDETVNVSGAQHNCRSLMYNLFDDYRYMEIADHYENVKEANGGVELICPICEVETANELDHYIPRNKNCNPDYSVHIHNLIPLCHTCNNNKNDVWIENTKRVFFNAYVDSIPDYDLFICNIYAKDGYGTLLEMPHAVINMSQELINGTSEDEMRIKSTIDRAKLLKYERYPAKIQTLFREEVNRIIARFRTHKDRMSVEDFWDEEIAQYQRYLQPKVSNNILMQAIYAAFARNEQDVRDWFVTNLPNA